MKAIRRFGLALAIGLVVTTEAVSVSARPAAVFRPYLEQIREGLPPEDVMRLPAEILLGGGSGDLHPNDLIIKVLPTTAPSRLTVSLFTCESGPYPCLVGSFVAEPATSTSAQHELDRHIAMQTPITLANNVRGYLREGPKLTPPSQFSSVMWQQNDMIYTVSFLSTERQNILYMARSMATEPPILSLQAASPE